MARTPRTDIGYVGSCVALIDVLKMDDDAYRTRFRRNQIARPWVNLTAIKRNALLALGHIKDNTTRPILKEFRDSPDKVLSHTAQWALTHFS
jgi:epoxyqueuosine reductase QueG